MKDREKHKIGLSAYKKHVKEIEDWYDEMKVRQATTPQALDSVAELQQQLRENKVSYTLSLKSNNLQHLRLLTVLPNYNNNCRKIR